MKFKDTHTLVAVMMHPQWVLCSGGGCGRRAAFWMKLLGKALSRWEEREVRNDSREGMPHQKGRKQVGVSCLWPQQGRRRPKLELFVVFFLIHTQETSKKTASRAFHGGWPWGCFTCNHLNLSEPQSSDCKMGRKIFFISLAS